MTVRLKKGDLTQEQLIKFANAVLRNYQDDCEADCVFCNQERYFEGPESNHAEDCPIMLVARSISKRRAFDL